MVSVEILPPRGWGKSAVVEPARALKVAGVDTLALVDNPRSLSRMGAISAAQIVEREVGIEALVHYTCRDRNMLGMISDLLGAAAAGVRKRTRGKVETRRFRAPTPTRPQSSISTRSD